MGKPFQRILNLVLSLSLFLSTTLGAAPLLPTSLPAGDSAGPVITPALLTDADDYNRQYADLQRLGEGQPKSAMPADRFLLMDQTVTPKEVPVVKTFMGRLYRKWALQAIVNKSELFLQALASGKNTEQPFAKSLSDDEIRTSILDHVKDGRRADTPRFFWDRRMDSAQLNQIKAVALSMQTKWLENERDKSVNPTEAPLERKNRIINWWDVQVQVVEKDKVVSKLNMADTSARINTAGTQPYFCASDICHFNLVKGETKLHAYGIDAKVVATFDQYIVFATADGFDATNGTQYLMFIDLGTYNGLIGNEDIPVFRLPLKTDEAIHSLGLQDGKLVLNGKFNLERSFLDQASDMQQVAFNLQANLITPESWGKVLPLIDSVQEYFKKSVSQTLQVAGQETDGLKDVTVLMSQLGRELQDHLDVLKKLKPVTEKAQTELGQAVANTKNSVEVANEKISADAVELYHARVSQSAALAKAMGETQKRARVSRQLMARVKLLGASLISPRPFASQKIKEALGMYYVKQNDGRTIEDRLISLSDRPYVNAGVIAAAILAASAPETFNTLIQGGLGVSTGILDYVVSAIRGFGEATAVGTKATFAALIDPIHSLGKQYIDDGNLARTAVGIPMFLGFLGALYFVPHFLFNFAQLFKDLRKPGINGFLDRQNKFKNAYYARLAADEGESRNLGSDVQFSPDEEREIQAYLTERRLEISNRRLPGAQTLGKLKTAVQSCAPYVAVANGIHSANEAFAAASRTCASWFKSTTVDAALENQTEELQTALTAGEESTAVNTALTESKEQFTSFWAAAKHFAFSMPSLELTLERWANIWNSWASWRFTTLGFGYVRVLGSDLPLYIKFKPVSFAARLLYPEFLATAVYKRTGRVVIPTEANGGLRSRCTQLTQAVCGMFSFNSNPETVNPKRQLAALKKFEDQIIEAEEGIVEVAFRKSLEDLPKFMKDKEDLKKLFKSTSLNAITQKEIGQLSWSSQTFIRAHFESIYQEAMNRFLNETLDEAKTAGAVSSATLSVATESPSAAGAVDTEQENAQRTIQAMKAELVKLQAPNGELAEFGFDVTKAASIARTVAADPAHYQFAAERVAKGRVNVDNFAMNTRYSLATDMDPKQNRSFARIEVVHRRLQSSGALGRAVRAEISKLKLTFPIDLTFKLFLSAGIYEGAFKPIQESFWGPNSTFYLSHTSFYMIMASGFFMSMMADAWMKLQMDARQDEMGEFGHIPQGEDAEKGFLSWYYKQYTSPENSIMKNWAFSNSISFWNLPAALANISLFYFMFSGRVDLSLLVAGYAIAFGTPISALYFKIDQAFERAAHFAARGVKDEKWLAHPDVQELLVPETQRLRDRFTIFKDAYLNIQGNLTGNIEMIPTSLGPRGLQRALFGGGLLEEYIVNGGLLPLKQAIAGIPVLDHVVTPIINLCETLLTTGNTDLVKLKK